MQAIDFSRSFLHFRMDWEKKDSQTASHKPPHTLNNCRIQVECVCTIEDRDGHSEQFALGASCKTERVGVDRDIWTEPNADFMPIFGRKYFMIIKAFDLAGKTVKLYPPSLGDQPERQVGVLTENYDGAGIDIVRTEGQVLESPQSIVEASLTNRPLTAITKLTGSRYTATLEYPVKSMNANERDWVYQTDTGPVLLPDLERDPDDLINGMEIAYVAFNCPDWIELIVRVPTPIAEDISVHHYSKAVRHDTRNQMIGY